jgi:signal transduction histidine kinase
VTAAPAKQTLPSGDAPWREISYDVSWEASRNGIIRCRQVLNRRKDIYALVEGCRLDAVGCVGMGISACELLLRSAMIRHVEVQLPGAFGPEHLYLSAVRTPEGYAGTLCAIASRDDETFRQQSILLNQVTDARQREESYRREGELMLQGLRQLLGDAPTASKIETLAALVTEVIHGVNQLVLQVRRDGVPRPLATEEPLRLDVRALTGLFQTDLALVTHLRPQDPSGAPLRRLLNVPDRDVAVIFLPLAHESVALVCASRRKEGFRPDDVAMASRFTLILKQALVLKEEQEKLLQAGKLSVLGQMSASLAHELRQPLSAISMVAQNLEMKAQAGPIVAELVTQKMACILDQVDRAAKVMDRVRRFSRRGDGDFQDTDLAGLASGVKLLTEPQLTASGVRLEVAIEEGLTVRCDAVQVEQVLANLVRNAMDALNGIGSVHKTQDGVIRIGGRRCEHGIALRVEDNGPGFPADVATRPLETFFTTKDASTGTGLGLSICHMVARAHAGTLTLGNLAKGAFVELTLPTRESLS